MMLKNIFTCVVLIASLCNAQTQGTDKTLVSWVTLADKNVRAGSVLTIQDGSQFDGIVFAERDVNKWMAGSNGFLRTQKDRDKSSKETADNKTMVQMAIVYKGKRISIYRNGQLYASYQAENIDLLSHKKNIVVFGLRHVGGGGSIAGAIEDARIYSKALTVDEIRALEPNKDSASKPYAWWDFEGDKIVDRAGRYAHSTMGGGAKLEGGKLVLGRDADLVAATTKDGASISRRSRMPKFTGPYIPETPAWPENPPQDWLTYHLAHPGPGNAMPGDPNPAFYYKGRYHMHYIYKNRTGFVFAHVSSKDMVHWKWHPTVLAPPTTGHGMFSGTGFFTREGKAAMVYHGQGSRRNWVLYALDDNMEKWSKPEVMLPTDSAGKLLTEMPYFDPDIWINNDTYYGMNARSSREAPVIMKSDNLKDWKHIGELLHDDFDEKRLGVPKGEDISCPNMFRIGNKWMLLCISHKLGCRYYLGNFKDEQYLPESHMMMSWKGRHFFAPESMLSKDGRRVMWAWLIGMPIAPGGVQSLPRELELPKDGVLRIKPLRELEGLRYDENSEKNITVKSGSVAKLEKVSGDAIELEITFAAPLPGEFGLNLLGDGSGGDGMSITAGAERKTLDVGNLDPPFELKKGEDLVLRVFIDKNLVEVFANDRQAVVYPHKHIRENPNISLFARGGDLVVREIKTWKMKPIFSKSAHP